MESSEHLTCACGTCGEVIQYLPSMVGQTVECPKCKEKSELPAPLRIIDPSLTDKKPSITCPICGVPLVVPAPACDVCVGRRRKRTLFWVAGMSAGVLIAVIGWMVVAKLRPSPQGHTMILAPPLIRSQKSINDLKPGRFYLEQKPNGNPAIAAGDIENDSDNAHLQLKAELDLLDAEGRKIGTVSDVIVELPAHQTWHFLATVADRNAVNVRFASIKEDQ